MTVTRKIINVNDNLNSLGVDCSTRTLQTIDYAHHEAHGGRHYFINGRVCLSCSEEFWFQISSCNTKRYMHMTWVVDGNGVKCTAFLEKASGMDCGSVMMIYNNNRNSANTSCHQFRVGVCAATCYCAVLEDSKVGVAAVPGRQRQAGGSAGREDELQLKCSTMYAYGIYSYSANNRINFHASWYEHTDKDD